MGVDGEWSCQMLVIMVLYKSGYIPIVLQAQFIQNIHTEKLVCRYLIKAVRASRLQTNKVSIHIKLNWQSWSQQMHNCKQYLTHFVQHSEKLLLLPSPSSDSLAGGFKDIW